MYMYSSPPLGDIYVLTLYLKDKGTFENYKLGGVTRPQIVF